MTEKEQCKKAVLKILRELEALLEEAERDGIPLSEFQSDLMYKSVQPFATAISINSNYSASTARDAINELIKAGRISIQENGFFELTKSKNIAKIVKNSLYVTPLPIQGQSNGTHYLETSDNAAPFLANLFNKSTSRNDKRFYSISHNLLLMLDLGLSHEQGILGKKEFDLVSFIKSFGIFVQDYDTLICPIDGFTDDDILETNFNTSLLLKQHEEISQYNHSGTLTTTRRVKRRSLPID